MKKLSSLLSLALLLALPLGAHAQVVVNDTLNGATSSYAWKPQGGACLTAGSNAAGSTLPACVGLAAYAGQTQVGGNTGRLPDQITATTSGALRLTNGDYKAGSNGNNMTGSVVSTVPFPTNQGVQVTFTTVTYGGNAYTNSAGKQSGADGIAFFLMDGSRPPSTGAFGGSLGYSCANSKNANYDSSNGVDGGYLGVGIDEFGNFSNPSDSTADGTGQSPGTIVVRGAGSITYARLSAQYPAYYPSSYLPGSSDSATKGAVRLSAVQKACSTGKLWNFSSASITDKNNNTILPGAMTSEKVLDYPLLVSKSLPPTITIYNQEATNLPLRGSANVLTYNLKITQDGLLSLSYAANSGAPSTIISNQPITAGNGPLPSSFLFGFTAGTGGGSNIHEIKCFKAAPINAAADSAGSNVPQAATLQAGTQVYLASYHPLNYWGQLTASYFVADSLGNLSVNPIPNWDAGCVLTGGACSTTGAATTAQAPSSRRVLTYGNVAVDFSKLSDLTSAQQTAIGGSTDNGTSRISYLRGDRSNEVGGSGTGIFRRRDGVLGDIRASSPTWVGPPSLPYTLAGTDLLSKGTIAEFGTVYNTFATKYQTRPQVVYIGANDGMLHGFRAGASTSAGAYDASNNDGKELLAYVPSAVVTSIHPSNANFDFSSTQYSHNAYVDATPAMGDLYYAGAWHTWLVGGLGAGASPIGEVTSSTVAAANATVPPPTTPATLTSSGSLYALDITDPANFGSAAATSLVIGELNAGTISCANDTACGTKFGALYGTPIIRRTHDGNWAVIFGNGRNSATGAAGVFIATVDYTSGAVTVRYLDTGTSNGTTKNGIDYVVSADLDNDHVVDYLYAGDTAGHVWRFDLTSNTPADWLKPGALSLVFTTPSGQPISTALTVNRITAANSLPRVVIAFGTGRQEPQTPTQDAVTAPGKQYLYGIWDWDMAAWNGKASAQYALLTQANFAALSTPAKTTITTSDLVSQVIGTTVIGTVTYRTGATIAVCWADMSTCSTPQFGWMMGLPGTNEQLIYNPTAQFNTFFANTTIPAVNQTLTCDPQPASGYSMAVTIVSGSSNGTFAAVTNNTSVIGIAYNATGTSAFITTGSGAGAKTYMYGQTISGNYFGGQINRDSNKGGKRLTWVKLK